jgi:UDP-N-acetylmuramyl pentapeptide synthase
MKTILRQFLKYYLKFFARAFLLKNNPVVIAVAGSANQYFIKEAIKQALPESRREAKATESINFNTEIGLSLEILNLTSGYNSYRDWLPAILGAPRAAFGICPKYLVVGLGVSNRGDMKFLLSVVKPRIAVIGDITQRYMENFGAVDRLIGEYEYLVAHLPGESALVLNIDNAQIACLKEKSRARVIGFGQSPAADWRIERIEKRPPGVFIAYTDGLSRHEKQLNVYGEHNARAFLAGEIVKSLV